MDKKNEIIVKVFQRLKTAEQQLLGWTAKEWRDAMQSLSMMVYHNPKGFAN